MSSEELRRERVETYEELRRTQDVSGSSNFLLRGLHNATRWEIDYGGWYSSTFTGGDNGTDRSAAAQDALDHTWEHDERFFLRIGSASKRTTFYGRLKTTATHNHTSTAAIDRNDWVQPTFDMFYLERAMLGRTFKHTWTFGRQYAQVERGISFGMVADGIRYEMASKRNTLQFFWLMQPQGDDNVDATVNVTSWHPGRTKRWFSGLEWNWKMFTRHSLGLFWLDNMDNNRETADGSGQRHQLDSFFYGIGFNGSITSRWSYFFQYVQQDGKTYASGGGATAAKIDMSSSAIDIGTRYFFPTSFSPTVYFEYASGSGDGDATGSATGTAGGSTAGKDERFISFGGLALGYALSPQLINIDVTKFGFSFKPFGWSASSVWSEILLQPTFYLYSKDKAAGATSDPVATSGAKKIGDEIDLTVAWRLSSDLKYQLKWGRFSPGAAYPAGTRASETYLRLKLSLDL